MNNIESPTYPIINDQPMNRTSIEGLFDEFSPQEVIALYDLRGKYDKGEINEDGLNRKKLNFARWLYEHDRIDG